MQRKKFATVMFLFLLFNFWITRKSISVDRNVHIRDGKRGGVVQSCAVLQAVCVSRVRCKPCPETALGVGSV